MKFKIAIIGAGSIAGGCSRRNKKDDIATHARTCQKTRNIELVAACDSNPSQLKRFCRRWKVGDQFRSVDTLLKNQYDCIVLCTPDRSHFRIAKKIILHKHHPRVLLVEKPLCCTREELVVLRRLAKKKQVLIITNHKYRFSPELHMVQRIIKQRRFGSPIFLRATYYAGLLNNGVHVIDTIRMLTGSELKVVSVRAMRTTRGGFDIDAILQPRRFPKVDVHLESHDERFYQLYEMEIRFEKGRIRILDFGKQLFIDRVVRNKLGERELKNVKSCVTLKHEQLFRTLYKEMVCYLKSKKRGKLNAVSLFESGKTLTTVWDILQEAQTCKS